MARCETLKEDFNVDLPLIGVVSGSNMMVDAKGIALDGWKEKWAKEQVPCVWDVVDKAAVDSAIPNICFVDCTASGDVAAKYEQWLTMGYNVITPNKKVLPEYLSIYSSMAKYEQWVTQVLSKNKMIKYV
eukprot:4779831-Pyramimonas_sp.AAC.1